MRLNFYAISSDSHDTGHLASNLQDGTPHSLGWISAPFPAYPQVLTFAFEGEGNFTDLRFADLTIIWQDVS